LASSSITDLLYWLYIMQLFAAVEWNQSVEEGILTFIGEWNTGIVHLFLR
jgi:hypothetical protein